MYFVDAGRPFGSKLMLQAAEHLRVLAAYKQGRASISERGALMARRKPPQQGQGPQELGARQSARFPWDGLDQQQLETLEAAHERVRCLRAGGHVAISWERSHGDLQRQGRHT